MGGYYGGEFEGETKGLVGVRVVVDGAGAASHVDT